MSTETLDRTTAVGATSTPDEDMRTLDRLVGSWRVTGEAEGEVRYEWTEAGFFLLQHLDLVRDGHPIRGLEVIGHRHGFGEALSTDIRSRVYSFLDGLTLDYVYELAGDTLTIWGGERGSPSYYRGTISGDAMAGAWHWPGGGYAISATRVRE